MDIVVGTILGVLIASVFNIWYILGGQKKPSSDEKTHKRINRLEAQLRAIKKKVQDFEDKAK